MALVKRLVLYFPVFLIVKIDNGISLITVQTTYQKDLNLVTAAGNIDIFKSSTRYLPFFI